MAGVEDTFVSRARAIAAARVPFLLAGLALWSFPPARESLGLAHPLLPLTLALSGALAAAHALTRRRISPAAWRRLSFPTICADALAFAAWAVETGGLRSPFLPVQLFISGAAVLLFSRPLAALPAVAALAAIAWLDRFAPERHVYDLAVLVLYGSLHLALAYLLSYLDERERALRKERDRLVRDLGVHEERARIAREIHDGLGGSLAAIVYQAQLLENRCEDGSGREHSRLILETATEALEELRRSLLLLRSDFDLPTAIRDHCDRFSRRADLPVAVRVEDAGDDLSDEARLSIVRVLQEALHNAWRHAGASSVEVVFARHGSRAVLRVRDDGEGFVPDAGGPGRYGLASFRERAERVGGEVVVQSAPGAGTEIRFLVSPAAKEIRA